MPKANIVLEALQIESYTAFMGLGTDEIVRRMDENYTPVHEGDAFLALMVLAAVRDLRETTKSLDRAKRWFELATVALTAASVIVGIVGVAVVAT